MKKIHLILTLAVCLLMALPFAAYANDNSASAQTSWFVLTDDESKKTTIKPGETLTAVFEINDTSDRATDAALEGVYIWATDANGSITDALQAASNGLTLEDGSIVYTYYAASVYDGDTVTVSFTRKGEYVLHAGVATTDNPSRVSDLTQLQIEEKHPTSDDTNNSKTNNDDEPLISPAPTTNEVENVQMIIGSKHMYVNHKRVNMDVAPYIHYDYTYVPIRALTEAFGADVSWNASTRQVQIKADGKTILMTIGSKTATVEGKSLQLVSAPEITSSRTFVAIRDIAELLDYDITAVTNPDGTVNYVYIER